jgi:hypothetical protein
MCCATLRWTYAFLIWMKNLQSFSYIEVLLPSKLARQATQHLNEWLVTKAAVATNAVIQTTPTQFLSTSAGTADWP